MSRPTFRRYVSDEAYETAKQRLADPALTDNERVRQKAVLLVGAVERELEKGVIHQDATGRVLTKVGEIVLALQRGEGVLLIWPSSDLASPS